VPSPGAARPRAGDVRLGIIYMIASVFLFSFQNAIGKGFAQTYPIPMLVFFAAPLSYCRRIYWFCT
jgi:hypothetical protein